MRGSGTMAVDGETIALRPGVVVRVDSQSRRVPTAGDEGLTFVAIGSPVRKAYEARGPF